MQIYTKKTSLLHNGTYLLQQYRTDIFFFHVMGAFIYAVAVFGEIPLPASQRDNAAAPIMVPRTKKSADIVFAFLIVA